MNIKLYETARSKINYALYAGYIGDGQLDSEVIEDYVADTASCHDEENDYATNWESEVQNVVVELCRKMNVEYFGEEE